MTENKTKPSVMVVDDDALVVDGLRRILTYINYAVDTFTDPLKALEAFREKKQYYAVITDVRMPKMSGDQLVREILKINPVQPCIILTGYTDREDLLRVMRSGKIVRILSKPCNRLELIRTLTSLQE